MRLGLESCLFAENSTTVRARVEFLADPNDGRETPSFSCVLQAAWGSGGLRLGGGEAEKRCGKDGFQEKSRCSPDVTGGDPRAGNRIQTWEAGVLCQGRQAAACARGHFSGSGIWRPQADWVGSFLTLTRR